MLGAPDTDPTVRPTPILSASGWWASAVAAAVLVVEVLDVLPPLPAPWDRVAIVVGALAGFIVRRAMRDSYRPVPTANQDGSTPRP